MDTSVPSAAFKRSYHTYGNLNV